MTVEEIKAAIEQLSEPERRKLADWLEEIGAAAWDAEMERDFSPGGRGERLLDEVNQEIDRGKFRPLKEGLRARMKPH